MADAMTLGRLAAAALALPGKMADAVERTWRAEADVAQLRGLLDHTMGERDALRKELHTANRLMIGHVTEIVNAADRNRAIADENRILTREAADLRADVQRLTQNCADLDRVAGEYNAARAAHRFEIDHARDTVAKFGVQVDGVALARAIVDLGMERDEARAELAALRKPTESSAPQCAHCLWPVDSDGYVMGDGSGDVSGVLNICACCADIDNDVIRARVALRASSCPTRRTSPAPLAVECTLGCGAPVGVECREVTP